MSKHLPPDAFKTRREGLEAEYFRKKDADLVGKLKTVFDRELGRDELRNATGIKNDEVLDRLLAVNARGEMLLAFRLYPLVEVAWADGRLDQREADAVVEAALKLGVPADSAALEAIKDWLKRGVTEDGRLAWYMYADELKKTLTAEELKNFREELLEGTTAVAEASGGILNIAFQISDEEQRVLDHVAETLTHD